MLGIMTAHILVIQRVPRVSGWQIPPLGPPMASIKADHGKQCLSNLVQYENTRLLNVVLLVTTMKDQDFRKGSQQVLLHTSDFFTLLTGPGGVLPRMYGGRNRIRNTLTFGRRQRKLQNTFANQVGLIAVQASNAGPELKPQKFVQP